MTSVTVHCQAAAAAARWTGKLTSKAVGIPVQFTFDESWEGLAITGYAKCGSVERKIVLDGQGRGKIPPECLIAGQMLLLGAKGVAIDGSIMIPTIWAATEKVSTGTGDSTAGSADPDPTPEQVDLITAVAQEADRKAASAEAKADDVVARANAGEFDGADGYTPVKNVDYFDGNDGYTPVKGVDYFDGENGVSPTVTVADIEGGHRVTITDAEGPKSFDVKDGGGSGGGAVDSVNGKTGAVELNAHDVGALPANTPLFDGDYNSLVNKPTIPEAYDDSGIRQLIGQKYSKPNTGIPASDLASGVIPAPVTDEHINGLIDSKMPDIPDKLPNPNALTFTGAATGSYDGSQPLSIEIPQGGGGGSIDVYDVVLSENVSAIDVFTGKSYKAMRIVATVKATEENILPFYVSGKYFATSAKVPTGYYGAFFFEIVHFGSAAKSAQWQSGLNSVGGALNPNRDLTDITSLRFAFAAEIVAGSAFRIFCVK